MTRWTKEQLAAAQARMGTHVKKPPAGKKKKQAAPVLTEAQQAYYTAEAAAYAKYTQGEAKMWKDYEAADEAARLRYAKTVADAGWAAYEESSASAWRGQEEEGVAAEESTARTYCQSCRG